MANSFGSSQSRNPSSTKPGFLKSIVLKNFMCHDHFEVKFNPNINFVIGKNGSGKSAVQTGVAVGLGGKALATNRGASMKDLIKSDKNNASTLIVLSNEGSGAYKPAVYGNEIKVERHFSRTSGGYKLRNKSGQLVSTEKRELDRIVSHFNIQTQNPICILHQDIARSFLNTSDPKKKYSFFMDATRFSDIDKMYHMNQDNLDRTRDNHIMRKRIVGESFKDVIEMKKKLAVMQEAKEKEKQQEKLENELLWSRVKEIETQLGESEKIRDLEIMTKEKILKKLKDGDKSQHKEELRELENKIKDIDIRVSEARQHQGPAQQTYFEKKAVATNLFKECREIKENEKRWKNKLDNCMRELEEVRSNASGIKERQEKIRQELAQREKDLLQLEPAEENIQLQRQQTRDTMDRHEQSLRDVTETLRNLRHQKQKVEGQVTEITNSASNLAVYGNSIVRIVEEVNKRSRDFKQKPIGPLGLYIKVKDPKWTAAVENSLSSSLLSAFCVDNGADFKVLNNIIRTACQGGHQPTIYCSKFLSQKHNIQGQETGTNRHKNLAQMLQIENPVVFNCLIDQLDIHTTLLIPRNEEAYELLEREHQVPKFCKRAFSMTGDTFYPAPNYKSISALKDVTRARYLQANQQDVIRSLKEEVKRLHQEIASKQEEERNVQQELRSTAKFMNQTEASATQLKKRRNQLLSKINELKDSIEPDEQTNEKFLIEETEALQEKLQQETRKLEEMMRNGENSKSELDAAKQALEEIQNTIAEADKEKAPLLGKIQQIKSLIQQASSQGDLLRAKMETHERKLATVETEIAELTEKLAQNTEEASQVCEPVRTRRTSSEILRELNNLKQYLKTLEEESGGSHSDLQRNYDERRAKFEEVSRNLSNLEALCNKCMNMLERRRRKKKMLLDLQITSCKHMFSTFLEERQFDGKLEFSTKNQTLEIKVAKNDGTHNTPGMKAMDTASLSGGEKSFSTVCFIMTLWQNNDMPFHFLDEFDVFMDGINRHTVMDILINYAEQSKSQFVLLTPLNTSSIKIKDNISVHRLKAPRD